MYGSVEANGYATNRACVCLYGKTNVKLYLARIFLILSSGRSYFNKTSAMEALIAMNA